MYSKREKPVREPRKFKQGAWNQGFDRDYYTDKRRQKQIRRRWREHLKEKKQEYNT